MGEIVQYLNKSDIVQDMHQAHCHVMLEQKNWNWNHNLH